MNVDAQIQNFCAALNALFESMRPMAEAFSVAMRKLFPVVQSAMSSRAKGQADAIARGRYHGTRKRAKAERRLRRLLRPIAAPLFA